MQSGGGRQSDDSPNPRIRHQAVKGEVLKIEIETTIFPVNCKYGSGERTRSNLYTMRNCWSNGRRRTRLQVISFYFRLGLQNGGGIVGDFLVCLVGEIV